MLTELLGLSRTNNRMARYWNATPENPAFDLNDPKAWDMLGGGSAAASGVKVSTISAMGVAAVHQAANMIAGDLSSLPMAVYRRLVDDDREVAYDHPAHYLIADQANEEKTAADFWLDFWFHRMLWSNAYAFIDRKGGVGEPIGLINLLPDRTAPARADDGMLYYETEVAGTIVPIPRRNVLHVRGLSYDGMLGARLVDQARDAWGLALAKQNFSSKFFKNGARIGGTLELPAAMGKPARDKIEEGFRKTFEEGDNPFKTVILREGAKFHAGQMSPEQAQLVESNEEDVRQVARFFNVPPSRLGLKDSVSYNSEEQAGLQYLNHCLRLHLTKARAECQAKLLSDTERRKRRAFIDYNTSKLIETDEKSKNEVLEIQRRNEIISADEWRRKINLNKRPDGKGGEYINPNTKPAPVGAPPQDDGAENPPPEPPAKNALRESLCNVLVQAVERMGRRVAKHANEAASKPSKFAAWVDSGAIEHVQVFDDAVMPAIRAIVSAGRQTTPESMLASMRGDFFSALLSDLKPLMEPPHTAEKLAENVAIAVENWQKNLARSIETILFGD